MRTDITITTRERFELGRLISNRNTPAKVVWRWQARFAEEGIDGLKRDKTRAPRRKPLSEALKAEGSDQNGDRNTCQRDALVSAFDGQGDRNFAHQRAADLGRSRFEASPGEDFQDLQ